MRGDDACELAESFRAAVAVNADTFPLGRRQASSPFEIACAQQGEKCEPVGRIAVRVVTVLGPRVLVDTLEPRRVGGKNLSNAKSGDGFHVGETFEIALLKVSTDSVRTSSGSRSPTSAATDAVNPRHSSVSPIGGVPSVTGRAFCR